MTADTFTTTLGMTKPAVGGSPSTWGDKINADLDILDARLAPGNNSVTLGADVAIAAANTLYSGPATSSVGISGQTWLVIATFLVGQSSATTNNYVGQIYAAGTAVGNAPKVSGTSAWRASGVAFAVCVLSAATVFTLKVKNLDGTTGSILADSNITAIRIS